MDHIANFPKAEPARQLAHRALAPFARRLVAAGISADAVTIVSLALSLVGALMLARGRFEMALPLIVLASLGDALDGVVARVGATASPSGALLDASADRYQEAAILAGLAIYLHADVAALALVLAAMVASFMVSYGSAKAEALRVAVPAGSMRRFERSVCICVGVAGAAFTGALSRSGYLPPWTVDAPILFSLGLVAVVGNASAAARLRVIASATRRDDRETSLAGAAPPASHQRAIPQMRVR